MKRAGPVLALLWGLLAAAAGGAPGAACVAVLPPENLSDARVAEALLAEGLERALGERGWSVCAPGTVEEILHALGERHLDSLPGQVRGRLAEELGAVALVHSTVETWSEGTEAVVALSARMLDPAGSPLWSAAAAATAAETGNALGFGRAADAREVAAEVIGSLVREVPRPGERHLASERRARPPHRPRPAVYRAAALEGEELRTVLLPFDNRTGVRSATATVGRAMARRLEATGRFRVVEAAELRDGLRAERIPSIARLEPEAMRRLGSRIGTSVFVRGTVWKWREGPSGGAAPPEVELDLELVDAAADRVLASASLARRGDDYERLLRRNAIGSAALLADQMIAEMLEEVGRARAPEPRALTTHGEIRP